MNSFHRTTLEKNSSLSDNGNGCKLQVKESGKHCDKARQKKEKDIKPAIKAAHHFPYIRKHCDFVCDDEYIYG
jgi:hypothetical protein